MAKRVTKKNGTVRVEDYSGEERKNQEGNKLPEEKQTRQDRQIPEDSNVAAGTEKPKKTKVNNKTNASQDNETVDIKAPAGNESRTIGVEEIRVAAETLRKYKAGKANLEKQIIENEQWWKMRHWEVIRNKDIKDPEPVSAWLFNSLANKHADFMDNYPEPSVLPRTEEDEETASQLSSIVPIILEQNEYEQVYSDATWYKIKQGTGVKGIFWNATKNGIGDIDIKRIDLLNLFWEPGINDIQESRNVFNVELVDNDIIMDTYGIDISGNSSKEKSEYVHEDHIDTTEKSCVIDWYYKKNVDGKDVLHYVKFVDEHVLYASENEEEYKDRGFYDHGKYPFVFDVLFVKEGSPTGFGYIDVMKDTQMYIDKMQQSALKNTIINSKPRYFISDNANINEDEFANTANDFVHVAGGNVDDNSVKQIKVDPLSGVSLSMLEFKIDELKETSGNRDFSQGAAASGVTAASAIAALQEAGSKLSRDMIKASYRAFCQECYLVIDLIRQFYDMPRDFRVEYTDDEMNFGYKFEQFDNSGLIPKKQEEIFEEDMGYRTPIFDVNVTASKKSNYSRSTQNELALQFLGLGFFQPEMCDQALSCIEMMDFDGKDRVAQRIKKNGTMYQQLQQMQQQMANMQQQMLSMGMVVDMQNGTQLTPAIAEETTGQLAQNEQQMQQGKPNKNAVKDAKQNNLSKSDQLASKAATTARNTSNISK